MLMDESDVMYRSVLTWAQVNTHSFLTHVLKKCKETNISTWNWDRAILLLDFFPEAVRIGMITYDDVVQPGYNLPFPYEPGKMSNAIMHIKFKYERETKSKEGIFAFVNYDRYKNPIGWAEGYDAFKLNLRSEETGGNMLSYSFIQYLQVRNKQEIETAAGKKTASFLLDLKKKKKQRRRLASRMRNRILLTHGILIVN